MYLELEFPVLEDDITEKHIGDAEVDFANRAVERVRKHLDKLLENTEFVHYYIMPTKRSGRARR
jgi:hypothetical protein